MNQDQIAALLRTVLQFAGGVAVGRGLVDTETMTILVGAVVTIVMTVWGLYARRNTALVASAAAVPSVKSIVVTPSVADKVDSPKVQTTY